MSIYYNPKRFSSLEDAKEGISTHEAFRRDSAEKARPQFVENPEIIEWTAAFALDIIERSERDGWNSPPGLDNRESPTTPTTPLDAIEKFFPALRKQFESLHKDDRRHGGIVRTWQEVAAAIPDTADFLAGVSRLHSPQILFINDNGQLVITEGGPNPPPREPLPYEISRAMATRVSYEEDTGRVVSEMGLLTEEELESLDGLFVPVSEHKHKCFHSGAVEVYLARCNSGSERTWLESGDPQVISGQKFALVGDRDYGGYFFPEYKSKEARAAWCAHEGEIRTDLSWAKSNLPSFWALRVNLNFKETDGAAPKNDDPTYLDTAPHPNTVEKPKGTINYDGGHSAA